MFALLFFLFFSPCLHAQSEQESLKITHLRGNFYVYTTWQKYRNISFPANGLYCVTKAGVVMIDSPWDTTQCQPLLQLIEREHKQKVVMCIATHFHEDRTGGFDYFRRQGIKTYTSKKTDLLCVLKEAQRPTHTFRQDTTFVLGGQTFQTYFAGEGHSSDNIVIWFPKQKILYGGCLIKSTESDNLGNLSDANVQAWESTMQNLLQKYPKTNAVITGHQRWDKREALLHTLKLAKEAKK